MQDEEQHGELVFLQNDAKKQRESPSFRGEQFLSFLFVVERKGSVGLIILTLYMTTLSLSSITILIVMTMGMKKTGIDDACSFVATELHKHLMIINP